MRWPRLLGVLAALKACGSSDVSHTVSVALAELQARFHLHCRAEGLAPSVNSTASERLLLWMPEPATGLGNSLQGWSSALIYGLFSNRTPR